MLGKRFVTMICVKVLGSNGAPKVSDSVSIHAQMIAVCTSAAFIFVQCKEKGNCNKSLYLKTEFKFCSRCMSHGIFFMDIDLQYFTTSDKLLMEIPIEH